jgi:hypothetical protein
MNPLAQSYYYLQIRAIIDDMSQLITPILATAEGQIDTGGSIALVFAIILTLLFMLACGYGVRFLIAAFNCTDPGPICFVNYDGSYPGMPRPYSEASTIKMEQSTAEMPTVEMNANQTTLFD